jgi:hypothetical protein
MSSTVCRKRQRSGETYTLCSSIVVKCGDKNENICKNCWYQFEIDDTWDDIFNDLLEESEFKIHKTDTVSVTISDKLMGTTVFTLDMEKPIRVVKQFDSTLKYALFTIVNVLDIDVGMNNIDKAACSTVKSAFDVLMRSSTVTKSPRIKAHTAEHFTGIKTKKAYLPTLPF